METEHRGWRIVEVEVDQECHGFRMGRVFKVLDEFDEPLPVLQHTFWSPSDARLTIDFVEQFRKNPKWPTTMTYDLNEAGCYRRNFVDVHQTLRGLLTILADCQEMGDDPTIPIREAINYLHGRCLEAGRTPG